MLSRAIGSPTAENMVVDVDVWVFSLDVADDALAQLGSFLDKDEQVRISKRHLRQDRQRLVAARGKMREVLSGYMAIAPRDLRFGTSGNGKPFLVSDKDHVPFFNLSHSGSCGALAICMDLDVGIDIEQIRDIPEGLADRYFSEQERLKLHALSDPTARERAFFCCWTRKEAVLKASGEGIARGLDTFTVSIDEETWPCVLDVDGDVALGAEWRLRHFAPANDVLGAVAVRCGDHDMSVNFRSFS